MIYLCSETVPRKLLLTLGMIRHYWMKVKFVKLVLMQLSAVELGLDVQLEVFEVELELEVECVAEVMVQMKVVGYFFSSFPFSFLLCCFILHIMKERKDAVPGAHPATHTPSSMPSAMIA